MKTDKELLEEYKRRVKTRLFTEDQLLILMGYARREARQEFLHKVPTMEMLEDEYQEQFGKLKIPANKDWWNWFIIGAAAVIKSLK